MSSRKNTLPKYQIVSQGSMAGNVTSSVVAINTHDNIGIQANVTSGTPSGTFDVQISADHEQQGPQANTQVLVAGNWIKLGSPYTATMTSGAFSDGTANVYFDITEISAPYIRLLYTSSSGSGNFDAFVVGKMI